jgi:hypothetical protein
MCAFTELAQTYHKIALRYFSSPFINFPPALLHRIIRSSYRLPSSAWHLSSRSIESSPQEFAQIIRICWDQEAKNRPTSGALLEMFKPIVTTTSLVSLARLPRRRSEAELTV